MHTASLTLPIIGYHHSPLSQKFGIPRQPNLVAVASHIRLIDPYATPDAFVGIEQYSHLWVLWQFHHNKAQDGFHPQVRPPRLGGNDKLGVFATRSMYRPSQLGLSVVRLERLQLIDNKAVLHIIGADMVDGTPIVDIKPYLPYVDGIPQATSGQVGRPDVLPVHFGVQAQAQLAALVTAGVLLTQDAALISELIAQDPRPAYRQDEVGTVFSMRYKAVDVDFYMNDYRQFTVSDLRSVAD